MDKMMTPGERADRVLAELDHEGLMLASVADSPRIRMIVARAIIANAIRAAVDEERKDQPGQVRLDLTADEVEELDRLTWSADVGIRDEGWQSDRRAALCRKLRDAIAVVRG
jgi:hypothetical protein